MPSNINRQDLHLRMSSGDRLILVEALGAGYYDDAHLPGAINIPPGQVDGMAPALLPDPEAQIVVYGTSTGASSDAVARRLEELGYTAVAVYRGGKEDWVEHGLPVERLDIDADGDRSLGTAAQGRSQPSARSAAFPALHRD